MNSSPVAPGRIRAAMPATLVAMESFIAEFRRRARCGHFAGLFGTELLLREALVNAVEHGSKADPGRVVRCVVRRHGCVVCILVEDDGDGFDWRRYLEGRADTGDATGRGLQIMRAYATRIRFNRKGNAVMILKRLERGSE